MTPNAFSNSTSNGKNPSLTPEPDRHIFPRPFPLSPCLRREIPSAAHEFPIRHATTRYYTIPGRGCKRTGCNDGSNQVLDPWKDGGGDQDVWASGEDVAAAEGQGEGDVDLGRTAVVMEYSSFHEITFERRRIPTYSSSRSFGTERHVGEGEIQGCNDGDTGGIVSLL
jgi:hypothetical protein